MSLTVDRVGVEADEILGNLFNLYLHDMSQWFPIEAGLDGRFRYDMAPHWKNRDPVYLARVDGALAGFAVVSSAERWINERDVNDVKEFFVLRRHRRSGVGESMARTVWASHPGRWLVRILEENAPAAAFWKKIVDAYTGGRFIERQIVPDGRTRIFYTFNNSSDRGA
jgi:predicted acetyltransferase